MKKPLAAMRDFSDLWLGTKMRRGQNTIFELNELTDNIVALVPTNDNVPDNLLGVLFVPEQCRPLTV